LARELLKISQNGLFSMAKELSIPHKIGGGNDRAPLYREWGEWPAAQAPAAQTEEMQIR
jgi:hypothetical protein